MIQIHRKLLMLSREKKLRLGSIILSAASLLLLSVSLVFLMDYPDPAEKIGRHLIAGALANAALAGSLLLIALIPLRKGEPWALWTFAILLFIYGIPILTIDALFVSKENILQTLLPQGLGFLSALVGLALAYCGISTNKNSNRS